MCGIFGYITNKSAFDKTEFEGFASKMCNTLLHRGPDGNGFSSFGNGFIGNARLSIIDIENGQQPFVSEDGNIHVVQNGEIFNYKKLRNLLISQNISLKSNSDTEVILKMYECFGINMIDKLKGMFAIAIMDLNKKKFYLIRDRVGEKPLYYHITNTQFYFSSEINGLSPFIYNKTISKKSVFSYLYFNYIPQPFTIFNEINSLRAGNYIELDLSRIDEDLHLKEIQWWSITDTKKEKNYFKSNDELIHELKDSIQLRLTSDVDVCQLLSGGIDSSLIALLLEENGIKLPAYTIYFGDKSDPDLISAKQLSHDLNIDHRVIHSESHFSEWASLIQKLGQPFGDTSFMSLNKVCSAVSQKYKVALSGDGADEMFAGYLNYEVLGGINENANTPEKLLQFYLGRNSVFNLNDIGCLLTLDQNPYSYLKSISEEITQNKLLGVDYKNDSLLSNYLLLDIIFLLPSNNLFKSDMCSMLNQLELRSPFLEKNLLDLFYSLDDSIRLTKEGNKSVLRKYLYEKFPRYMNLPKRKFAYPFIENFNKDYFKNEELLKSLSILLPFFNIHYIEQLLNDYKINPSKNYRKIRNLMALSLWLSSQSNINFNYND